MSIILYNMFLIHLVDHSANNPYIFSLPITNTLYRSHVLIHVKIHQYISHPIMKLIILFHMVYHHGSYLRIFMNY